ncbi:GNAT family N-acetyltransferase [Niallia sp. JL1B1071]|uniref:GNAT family N-acetyltransferase n=1 Tax=Niallia tiangongensis TaxID=3237105 RepID=UPI0037DD4C97
MLIMIIRPTKEDVESLHDFFRLVITDTYRKEGIAEKKEDLLAEIETKKQFLAMDLESDGVERCFLIAKIEDLIVGSIEYGPSSALICQCTNAELKDIKEIGTVFVHPEYQRRGIGNLLLKAIYEEMDKKGVEVFCLDSGYVHAQRVWKKKFGTPDYLLKDYWEIGNDHMIWKLYLENVRN